MKEDFSTRLNKAMTLRGLKQSDLVEKTGIAKSAISQYCSGKVDAKQTGVYLLAKALLVNEAWLMGYDVEMERTISPSDTESLDSIWAEQAPVLRRAGKLATPEERQRIANIIKATLGINDKGE
jgi:transcriptional regulator with XRE-family HTH domain